jgi:hypothetical protein
LCQEIAAPTPTLCTLFVTLLSTCSHRVGEAIEVSFEVASRQQTRALQIMRRQRGAALAQRERAIARIVFASAAHCTPSRDAIERRFHLVRRWHGVVHAQKVLLSYVQATAL